MDAQRYIRGLDLSEDRDDVLRMALYCEDDPEYHIWSREVERLRTDRLQLAQLMRVDE